MQSTKKRFLDEQLLVEAHNSGLTERELAKKFEVSRTVIRRYKKLLNLANHPRTDINIEQLKILIDENYSDEDITKILNIKKGKVLYHRLKTLNIRHSEDEDRIFNLWNRKGNYWSPEKGQQEALLGTLLGDSSLSKSSSISARGSFTHCIKQEEYALYKAKLLEGLCTKPQYKNTKKQILKGKNITSTKQIHIGFRSSPYLLNIWKLVYIDGKKTITKDYLDLCDEKSLALYYFDDGYLTKNNTARITMYSFSDDERKLFSEWMFDKFNIESTYPNNIVHIRKKSANTFFNLIKPYCVQSMQYKLPN